MICPKCGMEGIEAGDTFCRHCGGSVSTPRSMPASAEANSDASKGLELVGAAIVLMVVLLTFAVGPFVAVLDLGSALPWLAGAMTLAGLVVGFIGFELRHTH